MGGSNTQDDRTDAAFREQFNRVRHSLFDRSRVKPIRTVLITSAVNAEGKTMASIGLASAIARSVDQWALLLECDLRRPSIARRMRVVPCPGLVGHLVDGCPLGDVVQPTLLPKLSVIQAGRHTSNAAHVLASEDATRLVGRLKSRYDDRVIVLDAPPVMATPEPLSLASIVDAIILVVDASNTPRRLVRQLLKDLPRDKVLGVVLNRARVGASESYYYYAYYYHTAAEGEGAASVGARA
jgi:capsular exopolysaccharide synthesis family protein